jgi:hypothetical protein
MVCAAGDAKGGLGTAVTGCLIAVGAGVSAKIMGGGSADTAVGWAVTMGNGCLAAGAGTAVTLSGIIGNGSAYTMGGNCACMAMTAA